MKTKIFLLLALCLTLPSANALIDIRAGYGANSGSPSEMNAALPGGAEFKTMTGFNVDAVVVLPAFPLELGVRYENISQAVSKSNPQLDTKLSMTRIAGLVGYRFIDTLFYAGVLGSVGASHTAKFSFNCPSCPAPNNFDIKAGSAVSYSAGGEAGARFGSFLIGAEAGYASMSSTDYTLGNSTLLNNSGSNMKVDFNGIYYKAMIGVGF